MVRTANSNGWYGDHNQKAKKQIKEAMFNGLVKGHHIVLTATPSVDRQVRRVTEHFNELIARYQVTAGGGNPSPNIGQTDGLSKEEESEKASCLSDLLAAKLQKERKDICPTSAAVAERKREAAKLAREHGLKVLAGRVIDGYGGSSGAGAGAGAGSHANISPVSVGAAASDAGSTGGGGGSGGGGRRTPVATLLKQQQQQNMEAMKARDETLRAANEAKEATRKAELEIKKLELQNKAELDRKEQEHRHKMQEAQHKMQEAQAARDAKALEHRHQQEAAQAARDAQFHKMMADNQRVTMMIMQQLMELQNKQPHQQQQQQQQQNK
jgi:hypothetical protein